MLRVMLARPSPNIERIDSSLMATKTDDYAESHARLDQALAHSGRTMV